MTTTINATDLRRRVREVLDRVRHGREAVIVQTYDTPQAVLIPYDDYLAFRDWKADRLQRSVWLDELQAIAREVSSRTALSNEELQALIDEAIEDDELPTVLRTVKAAKRT